MADATTPEGASVANDDDYSDTWTICSDDEHDYDAGCRRLAK